MITSITVLSYEGMLERARGHRIPANAFVVSIIDPAPRQGGVRTPFSDSGHLG